MKVLTIQSKEAKSDPQWVDGDSLFTLFKSREEKLSKEADRKAGYLKGQACFSSPNLQVRVVERTERRWRAVLQVSAWWSLIGAMVLVFVAFVGGLLYLVSGAISAMNHEDHDFAILRSSVLDQIPNGHTKTAEAAYDLTEECLGDQGFTEGTASLYSRCQSLSLDYVSKGTFSDSDKQAARYVITDLITRQVQLNAKYNN